MAKIYVNGQFINLAKLDTSQLEDLQYELEQAGYAIEEELSEREDEEQ